MQPCEHTGCDQLATVILHIPWDASREVCQAHARVLVQQDGVVAEPIDDMTDQWP